MLKAGILETLESLIITYFFFKFKLQSICFLSVLMCLYGLPTDCGVVGVGAATVTCFGGCCCFVCRFCSDSVARFPLWAVRHPSVPLLLDWLLSLVGEAQAIELKREMGKH